MSNRKCHTITIPDEELGDLSIDAKISDYLNNADFTGLYENFYTENFNKRIVVDSDMRLLEIADHNVMKSYIRKIEQERFCVIMNSVHVMNSLHVLYARSQEEAEQKQCLAFILFDNGYSMSDIVTYLRA